MLRTALNVLFLLACVAILVAPTGNMVLPMFEQTPLEGVLAEVTRPVLALDGVMTEAYQRGVTAWYEQHYGVRPTASRLDNSVSYYLFGETRIDKTFRIGKRNTLFFDDQLGYYNGRKAKNATEVATLMKQAQDLLLERNKPLVNILIPTKTTVWREDVPDRFALPLPEPRPCDVTYDAFVDALTRAGVMFVDGKKVLADLQQNQRSAIYSAQGRHLASPAACILLEAALAMARPYLRDSVAPELDCSFEMTTTGAIEEEEYDLFRLLNVWSPHPGTPIPVMPVLPERVPRSERPDILIMGSSFGMKFIKEAERNKALGHIVFYYYNATVIDRDGLPFHPVEFGTPQWYERTFSKALFLVPIPEEYFVDHSREFVGQIIAALGHQASASGARP